MDDLNQVGPKTDRDWLEYFMQKVIDTQAAQDNFSRNKSGPSKQTWLNISIKHETELKELTRQLKARGYRPDKWEGLAVSQVNLF